MSLNGEDKSNPEDGDPNGHHTLEIKTNRREEPEPQNEFILHIKVSYKTLILVVVILDAGRFLFNQLVEHEILKELLGI